MCRNVHCFLSCRAQVGALQLKAVVQWSVLAADGQGHGQEIAADRSERRKEATLPDCIKLPSVVNALWRTLGRWGTPTW